ncbi:hypothetical protein BDR06DRAFT_853071, partial [Suillus hirtellus]
LILIGFEIDLNAISATLPSYKKIELIQHLHQFNGKKYWWTLHKFQQLAGWCEWSFNIFLLLKLGLSVIYEKILEKDKPLVHLHINNDIIHKLTWMMDHMENLPGLLFYKSLDFN